MEKFDHSYLEMAGVWAKNSYCKRRQVGALIVKDRMIISDGYNGTPAGFENICEDENGVTKPYVLHAEANAIINANRADMNGATLYLVGLENGKRIEKAEPCLLCRKLIRNAQIRRVES
jgi:dCMP deaminase